MIKKEHYAISHTGGFGFNKDFYLLDYNPGYGLNKKSIFTKSLSRKEVLEILKDENLIQIKNDIYVNKENNLLIDLYEQTIKNVESVYTMYFEYSLSFDIDSFLLKYEKQLKKIDEKNGFKMNLITMNGGNPSSLTIYSNKIVSIDKENSYNLTTTVDTIIEDITSDKSGLIIFNSSPGAGKSSLIKYLSQELQDKEFYFLNNNNIHILSNPEFTTYCLSNLKNCVLVLEDCEKSLMSRDINKGFDISNILNITDGIMGDLLNLKIIATLNTTDKLDTALLRKGRLIRQVTFNPLTEVQVINLSNSLGIKIDKPKEMMLCDVYNYENTGTEVKQTMKIGF